MKQKNPCFPRLKIIVIGVENSGKTTLVRSLSPNAKSIEHADGQGNSITVGLDIGVIELAGHSLHFFGTPGHVRFDFMRKIASHGAHIGILMIDSVEVAKSGIGRREKNYEQELIDKNIPYFICANKQDVAEGLPLAEIALHFAADVHPLAAKTGQGLGELRGVLLGLIEENKNAWFSAEDEKQAHA